MIQTPVKLIKNFEFNKKHYLQKLGTAIGTKMAPAYANLFMDSLESKVPSEAQVKPDICWWRYTDDIFVVWTKAEKELIKFLNYAHETIEFTWNWSRHKINFLDVQVINDGGKIETDLYIQPRDTHQYLFSTSCHPIL